MMPFNYLNACGPYGQFCNKAFFSLCLTTLYFHSIRGLLLSKILLASTMRNTYLVRFLSRERERERRRSRERSPQRKRSRERSPRRERERSPRRPRRVVPRYTVQFSKFSLDWYVHTVSFLL